MADGSPTKGYEIKANNIYLHHQAVAPSCATARYSYYYNWFQKKMLGI